MPEPLSDYAVILAYLRSGLGCRQVELARRAGVSASLINGYERGTRPLHRARLEFLLGFLGLGPEVIDHQLADLVAHRATARSGGEDRSFAQSRRRVEAVAVRFGRLAEVFTRSTLTELTVEGQGIRDREHAEVLWGRLKKRTPEQRLALVEAGQKFRHWALCERVAAESIEEAANQPAEALELALLAERIAELVPGPEIRRRRLRGYAGVHVSNARRVNNDVPAADRDFARAKKLWEEGAPGDPGLLNEAMVPWIEATLRDAQRRFPEALRRIDEALAVEQQGDLRPKLLLTKAQILHALGEVTASAATLAEAIPLIDGKREPRVAFGVEFQLVANLCLENRAAEAEPGLPRVRALGEQLGKELDLVRVVWVEGKVAAGVGRVAEAEAAFAQVRREVTARGLAYDAALVSLDLAVLQLEQGHTAEVKRLAESMAWIFASQGVEREALAALRLFCDAARRDAATADLAKRLVRYLYRAQHDPALKFEDNAEAGAQEGTGLG